MSDSSRVCVYLIVVPALYNIYQLKWQKKICSWNHLVGFVAEEMDFLQFLVGHASQRVRLVPSIRENIERYFSSYRVRERVVWELLLQSFDHGFSVAMFLRDWRLNGFATVVRRISHLIEQFEFTALRNAEGQSISAVRTHKITTYVALRPSGLTLTIPLRNSTKVPLRNCIKPSVFCLSPWTTHVPFDGKIEVRDIMKTEIDKGFVALLSHKIDERSRWERLPKLPGCQSVLSECIVKLIDD